MLILCIIGGNVFAHDIEVANADGVMICYNWNNDKTELTVTYRGDYVTAQLNWYPSKVIIPESVEYNGSIYNVTAIGYYAFGFSGINSVVIPPSVTSIEDYAFVACGGITSIIIPENVITIGNNAFEDCSLKAVTIPSKVTSIGNHAFNGNPLTSVIFSNGSNGLTIGAFAFANSWGLTSVTIPNNVTYGYGAFGACPDLTSIIVEDDNPNYVSVDGVLYSKDMTKILCYPKGKTNNSFSIPNSVTCIENGSFFSCDLQSVDIPNSVVAIGKYAFEFCNGLTSVTIPDAVTYIGEQAFQGCDLLTSVISLIDNPFEIVGKAGEGRSTFSESTFENATLYVPNGCFDKYKTTDGWKDFKNITESGSSGIDMVISNKKTNQIYDLSGRKADRPQKGINIIDGKKILVK